MQKIFSYALLILFLAPVLQAQDTIVPHTTHKLSEIVIYSASDRQPATHVDLDDSLLFVKSTGQEPSSILSETPSVSIYSDAGTSQGYSYFRMRGIDQTRINMTFDGVPLNEPEDQGAYFSNYPDLFASASKVQVQRGVGTSKNGVASYGGSVQLHSAKFSDSLNVFAGLGYGSFNNIHAYAGINTPLNNKFNLYLRAAEIYSDGYKYHSANHSQSLVASLGYNHGNGVMRLNIISGHQQNELAWLGVRDSLIQLDRRTNANSHEEDNFQQHLVQFYWAHYENADLIHQSSVYYTMLDGNYDFDLNNFVGLSSTDEMYNYNFHSNLFGGYTNVEWTPGALSIAAGLHGNVYTRTHVGSVNTLGQLYSNYGYKREGNAFARTSYDFGSLRLFTDLELRIVMFDYYGSDTLKNMQWFFFNPKGGATYQFNDQLNIYYTIGMTGREPTRNDILGGNDNALADSNGVVTFITEEEQVIDHELGFSYSGSKFQGTINAYLMQFKNEIVLTGKFGPNGLALTNNVDLSYRSGLEMTVVYDINAHLRTTANLAYNRSRIRESEITFQPILTPAAIGTVDFGWHNSMFEVVLTGRYQSSSFIDYANTTKLVGFFLLNSRVSCQLKQFRVSAFVNNLTSSEYFSNGYVDFDGTAKYFVQAPLNFHFAVQYRLR